MTENTNPQTDETTMYADLTPFAAAQVTNVVLKFKGIEDVEVKPQMMYTYAKKGVIKSNYDTRADGEKVYFDGIEFKLWLDKYITKIQNGQTGSRVDYDKLAEQYL
jgi:alpha-acetolactate decarboxylase